MNTDSHQDIKLIKQIIVALSAFNFIYSFFLIIFGSVQSSALLISVYLVFLGFFLITIKYSKIFCTRVAIVFSLIAFIFLISNFFSNQDFGEFLYLPVLLLSVVLFKGSQKITAFILITVMIIWRIQKEKLFLTNGLRDVDLPINFFLNLNFVSSVFLSLTFLKFILDQWEFIRKSFQKITTRQNYILEGAGLGAWDWWLDDNRVTFDRRWCEMLGLDVNSTPMHLSTWDTRVHPEDKEKAYASINDYLKGKTPYYESVHRVLHVDGSWRWILDRGRISEYDLSGKPLRFTGTHLEITKSKEIEAQLEEAQRVANIGSWSFDLKTKTIKWSKQMYVIFNEDPKSDTPSYERHFESIYPDDRELWQKTVGACISDGQPYNFRFRTQHASGEVIWVEAIGRSVKDSDGVVVGLNGTCRDITYFVLAEENTKRERSKVMHSAKLASLGEMSAGIAHEINNPLTIITGKLQIMSIEKPNYAEAMPMLESINKATERISKIVGGLKKFSRTSDRSNMHLNSLNEVIKESLVLISIRAKQFLTDIKFEDSGNFFVYCDDIEIQQVMINLVNNSIDAIKNLPQKWIHIYLFEKDNHIVIQVKDSGDRIKDIHHKRLFEPFFTTKPVGEGTGLGLSIVKGILDEHNASIELLMDELRTCFEIKFKKPDID